jgi:hypothetical protein
MEVIVCKSKKAQVRKVKQIMESAGNRIGSVWFRKRSDGKLRKMAIRLHVQHPTYATSPNSKGFAKRKAQDSDNMLITVFDVNAVVRAKSGKRKGKISGRGAYKSVPLDGVIRLCFNGEIYRFR